MSGPPILVIGGGVAGACCALQLRRHGLEVLLAEKETFPRAKVCGCCLGGAALETFEKLSLRGWLENYGIKTNRWKSSIGDRIVELALPGGVAISRERLDTHLVDMAAGAGVEVRMGCAVAIGESARGHVRVELDGDGNPQTREFACVVVAGGLNAGGLKGILPWRQRPHGPFGVSCFARCDSVEPGVIYMACDDDGYVGLVRLEDDRVDIAAALSSGSRPASAGTPRQRVESILARSRFADWELRDASTWMTTPPLTRSRAAGVGRLVLVGDAAGYVEPFTGEGMTWAAQSGIAAADTIAASIDDLSAVGSMWDGQLRRLLRRKKLACRAVTGALRSALARRLVAQTLTHWPSLAGPMIRSLNRA